MDRPETDGRVRGERTILPMSDTNLAWFSPVTLGNGLRQSSARLAGLCRAPAVLWAVSFVPVEQDWASGRGPSVSRSVSMGTSWLTAFSRRTASSRDKQRVGRATRGELFA